MWSRSAAKAFDEIKERFMHAPILILPDFNKIFHVSSDALGIDGMLSQDGHPVAFFNENLNEAKMKYTTRDRKSYVVVQAFGYWRHYLLPKEFFLF